MGCDGGTIPRRDELVRVKKKPEQKDKESELSFRWRHCAITQQPLQAPIVACGLGRLYCKESVLEGLLDRSKLPETASHITSLKDVRELVLTTNPAYTREIGGEKGESGRYIDHRLSPYACPVIGLELSGKFRFVFAWSCGCVVSEKALKEVPSKLCHKCQQPYSSDDLVFLNAEGEQLEVLRSRMEARKLQAKANKKSKKQKTQTATSSSESSNVAVEAARSSSSDSLPTEINFVPSSSSAITIKQEKETSDKRNDSPEHSRKRGHEEKSKKHKDSKKRDRKDDHKKTYSSISDPAYKKSKLDYSVAKDPDATKVYKSLFTSHEKAKHQTKAHWVTYNPFYN